MVSLHCYLNLNAFSVSMKSSTCIWANLFYETLCIYRYDIVHSFIRVIKLYITLVEVQVDVDLSSKAFFLLQMNRNVYVAIKKKSVNAIFIIK